MNLIDKLITSSEGYALRWHGVHDVLVDKDQKIMTLTVGSWLDGDIPKYGDAPLIVAPVEVYFETWGEAMLFGTLDMLAQTEPWAGGQIVETGEAA